jgi:hypothetical protein
MVFAHADRMQTYDDTTRPNRFGQQQNEYMLNPGQVGFGYKLANEGTRLAISIRHGVEIASARFEYGGGMQWRALRPGERQPADEFLDQGNWIGSRLLPLSSMNARFRQTGRYSRATTGRNSKACSGTGSGRAIRTIHGNRPGLSGSNRSSDVHLLGDVTATRPARLRHC